LENQCHRITCLPNIFHLKLQRRHKFSCQVHAPPNILLLPPHHNRGFTTPCPFCLHHHHFDNTIHYDARMRKQENVCVRHTHHIKQLGPSIISQPALVREGMRPNVTSFVLV
jgi:hypothetical protein